MRTRKHIQKRIDAIDQQLESMETQPGGIPDESWDLYMDLVNERVTLTRELVGQVVETMSRAT